MKVIKLSKPDCVPCQTVANFLQDNNVEYEEHDIYKEPELVEKYNLMGVPVTILFDDEGNEVQRVVGFNPPQLNELISKLNQ